MFTEGFGLYKAVSKTLSFVASLSRQGRLSCYHYSYFTDEETEGPRSQVAYPESYHQFSALSTTDVALKHSACLYQGLLIY